LILAKTVACCGREKRYWKRFTLDAGYYLTLMLPTIQITLLFAGILALMQCALTALVIARRLEAKVHLLDGGDKPLIARIRAHGNFAETVPICLIMMALLESQGLAATWIWIMGTSLVIGRLLHAVGLISQRFRWIRIGRLVGMVLTVAVMSLQGVVCIWMFF
jgi:uncharacterized protein